jgi:hypothetical protein
MKALWDIDLASERTGRAEVTEHVIAASAEEAIRKAVKIQKDLKRQYSKEYPRMKTAKYVISVVRIRIITG